MSQGVSLEAETGRRQRAPAAERLDIDGLTTKQFRFATLVFSGLSNADAYRTAYDCEDASETTIKNRAYETASLPAVQEKIRALRLKVEEQTTLSLGLNRDFVINGLMRLAQHATKESVQLGAYQTLGKTVGIDLFRETVRHENVTRSVEDVEAELKQKLDAMRQGLTIEGSSRAVQPGADKPATKDRRRKPSNK